MTILSFYFQKIIYFFARNKKNGKGKINFGRRYSTSRFFMYNKIERYIKKNNISGKILLISENDEYSIRKMFSNRSKFTSTTYPQINIMNLSSFRNGEFDVVVTDQVLEHVPNPFQAVKEMYRILKKGGFNINTSCTFNPIHDVSDYFRFTKEGFKQIHKMFNKIITIGSWGNRKVIGNFILNNYKSFDVRKNKRDYMLANNNDDKWPWVVWCIAQK